MAVEVVGHTGNVYDVRIGWALWDVSRDALTASDTLVLTVKKCNKLAYVNMESCCVSYFIQQTTCY